MNVIDLVIALCKYFPLLNGLEDKTVDFNPADSSIVGFAKSVTLTHHNITIILKSKSQEKTNKIAPFDLKVSFEIKMQNVNFKELYCNNNEAETSMRDYITTNAPKVFDTMNSDDIPIVSKEILSYLRIADEIASQAYLCSSGDNYGPGYFSEIIIEEKTIILKQINHWNARSIDHKDDYHMRNLEFHIPLKGGEFALSFGDEKIGSMLIHFSDNSSPNNKICGLKIQKEITEQRTKYESGTN